jgi:hypothetical protein
MFLPDHVQVALRQVGKIGANEVVKKEGDIYVAINVENQQRRIISLNHQMVENLKKSTTPVTVKKGLLKG